MPARGLRASSRCSRGASGATRRSTPARSSRRPTSWPTAPCPTRTSATSTARWASTAWPPPSRSSGRASPSRSRSGSRRRARSSRSSTRSPAAGCRPLTAGLATAILLAIGFSGTAFNFVLPHTNSATFGILCLLLQLLALSHRRVGLAGLAAGLVCLTRPEFAAVAAGVGVAPGWSGRCATTACAPPCARPPGWPSRRSWWPAACSGVFAAVVGTERLVTENLWPVDFIRVAGFRSQSHWMPFDLASAAGLVARAAIYLGGLAAVVAAAERWRTRRGAAARRRPVAARGGARRARAGGRCGARDRRVRRHPHRRRGRAPPPADRHELAAGARPRRDRLGAGPVRPPAARAAVGLVGARPRAAGGGCGARPARLQRVHHRGLLRPLLRGAARAARRDPAPARRRAPPAGAPGGPRHARARSPSACPPTRSSASTPTPRTPFTRRAGPSSRRPAAGPGLQAALDRVDATTRPGEQILAAPSDGGFYFMADRPPAVYEIMLLPGLLDSRADERRVIRRLRARGVRVAVVGARDFGPFGFKTFGTDYNQVLGTYLRGAATRVERVGDLGQPGRRDVSVAGLRDPAPQALMVSLAGDGAAGAGGGGDRDLRPDARARRRAGTAWSGRPRRGMTASSSTPPAWAAPASDDRCAAQASDPTDAALLAGVQRSCWPARAPGSSCAAAATPA